MGLVAFVLLPIVAIVWVITAIAGVALPSRRDWLLANRWWLTWPLLALYIGIAAGPIAGLVVLGLGAIPLGLSRRTATATHP